MANTSTPRIKFTISTTPRVKKWGQKYVAPPVVEPDVSAPVITAFAIPTTAASLTVPVTTFTASDNTLVTGYLLTESSATPLPGSGAWTSSPPAAYTFETEGSKTLYAWAKDAAGNVSAALSDSVTITLPVESTKFTQTFAIVVGGGTLTSGEQTSLAKFDYVLLQRFNYDDIGGNTWGAIKNINPDCKIILYQFGSQTSNIQDGYAALYLNTISRWNNARGHSQGNLNTDNPDYFLLDSNGARIYATAYPDDYLMDIGATGLQQYWVEATTADLIGKAYTADGIFMDGCSPLHVAGRSGVPVKYPTNAEYTPAVNSFISAVAAAFNGSQLIGANYGQTRYADGATAWEALDNSANVPDFLLEEGVFVTSWWTNVDSAFNAKSEWVRQVGILKNTGNIKALYYSHTKLAEGETGIDNYGKSVTFWETLWYALASFNLGKTDKSYFFFYNDSSYQNWAYYDEYDLIDLGAAVGTYQITTVSGYEIYWREFALGYVYVNPNSVDVNGISLPSACKQLTHDNMADPSGAATITSFNLVSHRGAFFKKV